MTHVFFAHSSHDESLVRPIAKRIEQSGFRCWFYERDAKQGENYTESVGRAIVDSTCIVFFASKESVESYEVRRELQFSHRRRKPILCVLANRASADLIEDEVELGVLLGTGTYIPFNEHAPEDAARSITDHLSGLGIPSFHIAVGQPVVESSSHLPQLHWITDGRDVKIEDLGSFVFANKRIKRFLEGDQLTVLCGNKGLGKTLLLRYKRFLMQEALAEHQSGKGTAGVKMIPEDRPFVDELGALPNLTKGTESGFVEDLQNSIRLWSNSIKLSVISHDAALREEVSEFIPLPIRGSFDRQSAAPSIIYWQLLGGLTQTELHKFLDSAQFKIDSAYRSIHHGVCIFIDRVDEATSSVSRQGWIHLQAGLIEAARICMNTNNHVRVYTTIREEAFANYESVTKPNLSGSVVRLSYSQNELHQMMNQLAEIYEGSQNLEGFLGIEGVTNSDSGVVEDSFSYLVRHTLGRPRDLVIICSELSETIEGPGDESRFRAIVKQKGSELIGSSVFQEMSVFLDCLRDPHALHRLYSLIPYNVLTRDEIIKICCEFNEIPCDSFGEFGSVGNAVEHPFCEMWNCGLIGVVAESTADQHSLVQRFKQRSDRLEGSYNCLPLSDYYLLHPSLQQTIHRSRDGQGYDIFRFAVVGHNNPWPKEFQLLLDFQREIVRLPASDLRKETHSLLSFLQAAMNPERSIREYARETISAKSAAMLTQLEENGFDDAALELHECLTNLLKLGPP